jgi:hypothetical protein
VTSIERTAYPQFKQLTAAGYLVDEPARRPAVELGKCSFIGIVPAPCSVLRHKSRF